MEKLPFRIYEGDSLLTVPLDGTKALIESILYENDLVMLIAEDKMGKTVLSTQMACNLTSGTPFLEIFETPRPLKVWYFAHEGKDAVLIERLIRTQNKVPFDQNNFKMFCGAKFRWNDKFYEGVLPALKEQYADCLPEVIFIDPLYAALEGDLISNVPVKAFIHEVRVFAEDCGAAVVLVHHMKKKQRDEKGKSFKRDDSDAYGSAVMKWAVDHVFWLDNYRDSKPEDKERWLKCTTQRGGNIADGIHIKMHEPDPLYFFAVDRHKQHYHMIITLLKSKFDGMNATELSKKSKLSKTTTYVVLSELLELGDIERFAGRTGYYRVAK